MLKVLLASALFAGLIAGLFAAGLQQVFLVPLIAEAELYESGILTHFGGAEIAAHDAGTAHEYAAAAEGGLTRTLLTVLMTVLTTCGFGLILVAGFALAERMHLSSIDLRTGLLTEQPMDKLAALVTELAQQSTWDYLVHTDLVEILEQGFEEIRMRIGAALHEDESLEGMGLETVAVRIAAVRPEAEVEKALRTPTRESIQQQADEATFQRRALAV